MDLKDKVAVVTGASSGIGAAIVEDLNDAGAKVLFTGRRVHKLEALAKKNSGTEFLAGDLLDPELPDRLLTRAEELYGGCDIVVNNAGLIETGPIATIDVEKVCTMVRVNVEAAFRLAYVALKYFEKRGGGDLVITSSVLGTKVRPNIGAYAGTKYALEALAEALRMEVGGTPIRVSCVQPGLVMTDLHRNMEVHPKDTQNIERPLEPGDVARCVRFILEQPNAVRIPRLMVLPGDGQI